VTGEILPKKSRRAGAVQDEAENASAPASEPATVETLRAELESVRAERDALAETLTRLVAAASSLSADAQAALAAVGRPVS